MEIKRITISKIREYHWIEDKIKYKNKNVNAESIKYIFKINNDNLYKYYLIKYFD